MENESIFSKIISGELPSYRLWDNEKLILILDINPISPGHCLLIPKKQIDYIFDVEEELYNELWSNCRWISKVLSKATGKRIGVGVEGLSIPHVHIHLVPIESVGDLDPCKAHQAPKEELESMYQKILHEIEVQAVAGGDRTR